MRASLSTSLLAHAFIVVGMGATLHSSEEPVISRQISVSLVKRDFIQSNAGAAFQPDNLHTQSIVHTKFKQARAKQQNLLAQQLALLKTIQQQNQHIQQTKRVGYLGRLDNRPIYQDYQTYWQHFVSEYGTKNYPQVLVDQELQGQLELDIAIDKTGEVDSVEIYRSSGNIALDNAAIQIAKSAGPYAPLPKEISQELDVLHIIRTWNFDLQQRIQFKH